MSRRVIDLPCTVCGTLINRGAKSGRCRSCNMAHNRPLIEAARIAAYRESMKDPAFAANNAAQRARSQAPELIARRVAAAAHAKTGWCPDDRRTEYFRLRKRYGKTEARRLIEDDMAAKERQRIAALSPFERQLERLRGGAKLVQVVRTPRIDPAFTLGGVAEYGG